MSSRTLVRALLTSLAKFATVFQQGWTSPTLQLSMFRYCKVVFIFASEHHNSATKLSTWALISCLQDTSLLNCCCKIYMLGILYLWTWLQTVNQLWLSEPLTAICPMAISCSRVSSVYKTLHNQVSLLRSSSFQWGEYQASNSPLQLPCSYVETVFFSTNHTASSQETVHRTGYKTGPTGHT